MRISSNLAEFSRILVAFWSNSPEFSSNLYQNWPTDPFLVVFNMFSSSLTVIGVFFILKLHVILEWVFDTCNEFCEFRHCDWIEEFSRHPRVASRHFTKLLIYGKGVDAVTKSANEPWKLSKILRRTWLNEPWESSKNLRIWANEHLKRQKSSGFESRWTIPRTWRYSQTAALAQSLPVRTNGIV